VFFLALSRGGGQAARIVCSLEEVFWVASFNSSIGIAFCLVWSVLPGWKYIALFRECSLRF